MQTFIQLSLAAAIRYDESVFSNSSTIKSSNYDTYLGKAEAGNRRKKKLANLMPFDIKYNDNECLMSKYAVLLLKQAAVFKRERERERERQGGLLNK